ncbi:MAG: ABC transporter permease [Deltaproteobacteria bacterium]|nr:ABC transporter permease [Deltaproteobacteria bacterium]
MNIRKLAWKNLARRKARALFTGLGIFLGIGTFVALSSLTVRMEGAVRDKLDKFGANILVTPRTEQLSLGFGDISLGGAQVAHARLKADDGKAIRSIALHERLRVVAPFFLASAEASGKDLVWMGVSAPDIADARPWWKIAGAPVRERGEVLLGSEAAAALDKGPGGTVTSGKKTFRIAGVLAPTGEKEDAMVIGDIRDVQALAGSPNGVTFFEVAAQCKDCPVEDIVDQIGAALPGAKVSAIRQVVESRKEAVDQFRRLGTGVSAIVLAIAGLMVVVTVMGNVQERTREIGVLRAVGFRRKAILSLLFWETGWISLMASAGGAIVGLAAGTLALPLFGVERGGLEGVALSPAFLGMAIGMGLGLLGTVPPARKAAALSPTEAIRSL